MIQLHGKANEAWHKTIAPAHAGNEVKKPNKDHMIR